MSDKGRRNGERAGGDEARPKTMYPVGPNLTAMDRKIGYAHKPMGKKGRVLRYNFSAHAGCGKGDQCPFSHLHRIKSEGLHWAVQYDLARRGGLCSGKRIEANAVEGFLQSLRAQNNAEWKKSVEESRGEVGRSSEVEIWKCEGPPGLVPLSGGNLMDNACDKPAKRMISIRAEMQTTQAGEKQTNAEEVLLTKVQPGAGMVADQIAEQRIGGKEKEKREETCSVFREEDAKQPEPGKCPVIFEE